MDVKLLVPIDHVLVLERVIWVSHRSILALSWLVPTLVPVCGDFGLCVLG